MTIASQMSSVNTATNKMPRGESGRTLLEAQPLGSHACPNPVQGEFLMKRTLRLSLLFLACLPCAFAQVSSMPTTSTRADSAIPALVRFGGTLTDVNGKPLTGVVGVTFLLYNQSQGGSPLWLETQNVHPDKAGRYSIVLGSNTGQGLPHDLFVSGEARWLGVQVVGEQEQPRVLLVAVPYALKAGDAETLGGLPASAFLLAAPPSLAPVPVPGNTAGASTATSTPAATDVTGSGTLNFLPLWTSTSNIASSVLFQSGSGSTAKVGINTTTPAATLDVKGTANVEGLLTLPATGAATASAGKNSQAEDFVASAFNSGTSAAVNQTFQWRAEPTGNNSTTPAGTLSLLFGSGTASPSETGLKLSSKGLLTFATGQSFPGAGTITGVTTATGSGLSGGGTSGTLSLKVPAAGITNAMLQTSQITLNANTAGGVTAPGAMTLGSTYTFGLKPCSANQILQYSGSAWGCVTLGTGKGTVTSVGTGLGLKGGPITGAGTLTIDTSIVPQLNVANTFTVDQKVTGNIGASGSVTALSAALSGSTIGVTSIGTQYGGIFTSNGDGPGLDAYNNTDCDLCVGVEGYGFGSTRTIGVFGGTASSAGVGVYGQMEGASKTGVGNGSAGVWGDSGGTGGDAGVLATADDTYAVVAANNSPVGYPTIYAYEENANSYSFEATGAGGGYCHIDANGNFGCTGVVSGVVPINGGARKVQVYAVEAPQHWFEDAGSGQLSEGRTTVTLEPMFGQTVNTGIEYHVFLTPEGDCEGLYVSNKTPQGFEVHELRNGHSSVAFDYRIMATRKGYENVRMAEERPIPAPRIRRSVPLKSPTPLKPFVPHATLMRPAAQPGAPPTNNK